MQPKIIDKFFLMILLLVLIALSALCLAVAFGVISSTHMAAFVTFIQNNIINVAIVCAAVVVLLALTFRVMVAFYRKGTSVPPAPTSILVNNGEFGALHITIAALDAMIQRFCHANSKIRECFSAILPTSAGVNIKLRLSVVPDVNLPEFTLALQSGLKEHIETLSGLKVLDVDVLIIPMVNANK